MTDMIKLMLKSSPTCTSVWKCNDCGNTTTQKNAFIQLKHITSDLTEFNEDICITLRTMTKSQKSCYKCNKVMIPSDLNLNRFLFITFKEVKASKLSEIPDVVEIQEDKILFGAILYIYPLLEGDSGHYVTAIKINENWSTFDDMKTQPHLVSKKKIFVVHTLIYTEIGVNTSHKTAADSRKPTSQTNMENVENKRKENTAIPKSTPGDNSIQNPESSLLESDQEIVNKIVILTNGGVGFRNTCAFDSVAQVTRCILY